MNLKHIKTPAIVRVASGHLYRLDYIKGECYNGFYLKNRCESLRVNQFGKADWAYTDWYKRYIVTEFIKNIN